MLKIDVSKKGQLEIEKEIQDVKNVAKKIKDSKPVRNMGSSLKRWAKTPEVKALEALDKKFLASPEGKRLVQEWKDFGEVLKKHVKKTKTGIHIENGAWDEINDELDDVADEYESTFAKGSKWSKAYEAGWKKALSNKRAQSVARRWKVFEKSAEWKALDKELHDLDKSL